MNLIDFSSYKSVKDIPLDMRPKCEVPGCCRPAQSSGKSNEIRFRKSKWVCEEFGVENGYVCSKHHSINYGMHGWNYKQFRKNYCENRDGRLGFKCTTNIVDKDWQLDADHIDGDPSNNSTDNIQTLCKCCHAIKTRDSRDYASKGRKTLGLKH